MNKFINISKLKWCCHHLHIDKSLVLNKEILNKSLVHMKDKWKLMRDIKLNYTDEDLKKRMFLTTFNLVNQGCQNMRTFIDVDSIVKLRPLKISLELKDYWAKKGITLQIGTQPLEGLESKQNLELFYKACDMVDFIGCLPSRDSDPGRHLDIVFQKATKLKMQQSKHPAETAQKHSKSFPVTTEPINYSAPQTTVAEMS